MVKMNEKLNKLIIYDKVAWSVNKIISQLLN